ncbi:tRNA pseudouridine(38-40) synthase TruA [Alkaliphilus pronyensis]|uniref:tRNA pseudouridine synthase A n=1 Tax=Alkaliphilus pronyensis TaxID=1482732 RepID=A0A6I0FC22_9FIRM|nr:tRNA pseudouridine(38-40) synthase TruA [Alkaliphilus pronyensis]KAB3535505.1 tRNA pseudouridine(38-40) synthase TruA [Alkaliphilus pronyensis]
MRNIKIEIQYDGTNFSGWQMQTNGRTVQEEIVKALYKLTHKQISLHGAGRTDAGVHAKGQVANFKIESSIPTSKIPSAINRFLPEDVSVFRAAEMPENFHARYSATGKKYSYLIYLDTYRNPLLRNYGYHIPYEINLGKMKAASKLLIGTHDFRGFMSSGSSIRDTVRRIDEIEFKKNEKNLWISFQGNGFLYNMVRIIVGTFLEIGRGRFDNVNIVKALETGQRQYLGPTAPPHGLYLDKVFYYLTH